MSDYDDDDKAKADMLKKKEQIKRQIAEKLYAQEKKELNKKSYTSFGKLLLSDEKSAPIVSFTAANKFNKGGAPTNIYNPGPIYKFDNKFKYSKPPSWIIGSSKRPPLSTCEVFEYYNHPYSEYKEFDISKLPKKWNSIKGGSIGLDPRIKFELKELHPGPGRYDPNSKSIKPKAPAYFLGEKGNITSIKEVTGTTENVGPGKYKVEKSAYTSKHKYPSKWSLPQSERKGLEIKTWTHHESYYVYDALGKQIVSNKKSAPISSFNKANKDKDRKTGMFPSHMSNRPTKVRINHPQF